MKKPTPDLKYVTDAKDLKEDQKTLSRPLSGKKSRTWKYAKKRESKFKKKKQKMIKNIKNQKKNENMKNTKKNTRF